MKKSLRFISLLIAAVFLISGTMMLVCYADEPAADQGGDQQPADQGGDQQPADQGGDQQPADQSGDQQPADQGGDQQPADQGGDQGGDSGQQSGGDHQSGDNSGQSGYDSDSDNNYSYNNYVDEDPEPMYYGDASQYDYNVSDSPEAAAGSVSSKTTLYNSSGMSDADAAPNEWSDIVLDEKTVKTGVADFSAIKSNTETTDNGDWILYLGYVLIGLSALGILYFIIATIAHRKAVQKAERIERRRAASPARSEAARMEARERRENREPGRRTSRFADEAPSYSRRASSKADTGEVYVPRRAAKRSR